MISKATQSQIKVLLFVFSSAILFGSAVAVIMVNHYDHGTPYTIQMALLSPKSAQSLSTDSPTFEYSKWNTQNHQWKKIPISLKSYNKFYQVIEKDDSIPLAKIPSDVFMRNDLPTLTLFLQDKEFQRIQFAAQNYYRVELRLETVSGATGWAYFYHPEIEKIAEDLFSLQELP